MSVVQRNLGAANTEKLRGYVLQRESSGNYQQPGNQFGFIGGYQFGAAALEDVGLLKQGASKLGNRALDDPNNWTIAGGKQAFLSNKTLQDQSFLRLADRNYNTLTRAGVINANTPPEKVAGYLASSHLVGAGGVIKDPTLNVADGNGTKAKSYYQGAAGAISGKTEVPPQGDPRAGRGTNRAPEEKEPSKEPFTGKGVDLAATSLPGEISVSTFTPSQQFVPLPQPNPLNRFSSFNVIFTLSSLSVQQCNFPETSYKQGNLGKIVARSGGGGDATPILATGRQYDFFIDDFEFELLMTHNRQTKGTNATTFSFTVMEPYSMGLFFQALNVAATENLHPNYLSSPFLLTMEFVGYLENGFAVKLEDHTRHLPIRLTNVQMNVNGGGAKYSVSALAWNEQAYFDEFNQFKTDIAIAGSTVLELLQTGEQGLQTVLNKRLQEIAKRENKPKASDEVVIIFPKEILEREQQEDSGDNGQSDTGAQDPPENNASATEDPNKPSNINKVDGKLTLTRGQGNIRTQNADSVNAIGAASMDFDMTKAGASASVKDDAAQSDPDKGVKRNRVVFDPKSRQFIFQQGTSIVNAISSVVTMSKYCKDAVDPKNPKVDEKGMVPWFRIESEVYIQPPKEGNNAANRYPLLLVYKVVPYMVHQNKLAAANTGNKGQDILESEVAKVYDYIYTGKNTEVLRFDLEFKTAVFSPSTADQGKTNFLAAYSRQFGIDDSSTAQTTVNHTGNEREPLSGAQVQGQYLEQNPDKEGSDAVDYRTLIAQAFNKALYDGQVDLINAEMEIMGDPYFIADSGIGNFSNSGSGSFNMTTNYSMDYQSGEVHVLINFRTPVDYGANGIMDFGPTEVVEAYSGLYKVNTVTTKVSKNKFTQMLRMLRVQNQETVLTEFGTIEGSEQTRLLREQEAGFDDEPTSTPAVENQSAAETRRLERQADAAAESDKPVPATVNPQETPKRGRRTRYRNTKQTVSPVPAVTDAAPEEQIIIYGP
jgi:hypothetical protein